jgi:Mg-chelatase subunit ChlD
MTTTTAACEAVRDDLAAIVDGDAAALKRHAEHLAECDACRDARHEARRAADLLVGAGDDHVEQPDLEARLLGALAARGPGVGAPAAVPVAGPFPTSSAVRGVETAKGASPAVNEQGGAKGNGAAPKKSRAIVWLVGLSAAAALVVAVVAGRNGNDATNRGVTPPVAVRADGGGRVAQIARAAADGHTGLELRAPGASAFVEATAGTQFTPGATLRTDGRTRARLDLTEGTTIVMNHGTELTLDAAVARAFTMPRGEVLADVAHLGDTAPHAVFRMPTGEVEVLGTKFVLAAAEESASVRVTRGSVRVRNTSGQTAEVKVGQEGVIGKLGAPSVAATLNLAEAVGWSELETPRVDSATGDAPIAGLGELRAKRPGDRTEERPLALASHKVTVRIVGNVARTEIEEVFRNDGNDELEGIYRFPLPPDARISKLALDVEGRMEEGAFVEKDRASKIWRGVIRNATRPTERLAHEEYVWVPGPWRDPALLEWQRGGRFELRIFPIPAHGERRIIIGYTQTVAPHGDGRRYVYPLPFGSDPSLRVGRFELDARITGASRVSSRGYETRTANEDGAQHITYSAQGFLPAGDLVLEYATPDGAAELRAFTYQGTVAVPSGDTDACAGTPRSDAQRTACTRATAQNGLAADTRPYVAFTLRPELPAFAENKPRDFVFVVDASQSMVGERFTRAQRLVAGMVSEMDRRDRFVVLACDSTCNAESADPIAPSAQSATALTNWLAAIRPAGASDVVAALRAGAHALDGKRGEGRDLRVIYFGDGLASVGPRRVASISAETEALVQDPTMSVTTVGIGGDADTQILAAIARSGGGHYVPYVPGERTGAAALAVLETTYGTSLEGAALELPEGVVDVSPARLPTIRAGQEIIVTARLTRPDVQGEVVLRGKVAGQPYVDRYPLTLRASTAAGNLFVPRLWAAGEIEKLELSGTADDRNRIVALSKGFGVMSRETSLLVLESDQMFRAFGVDREQPVAQWTGEEDVDSVDSTGTVQQAVGTVLGGNVGTLGVGDAASGVGRSGSGGGVAAGYGGLRARGASEAEVMGAMPAQAQAERRAPSAAPAATAAAAPMGRAVALDDMLAQPDMANQQGPMPSRPPMGGGRWMRRVYFKVGDVAMSTSPDSSELAAVAAAESALTASPDSRDRHRELVRALSRAGNLTRAAEIAEKWLGRDALDAEALTYLADVVGRQGKRDEALRLLTGIVDLRSDDRTLQERLAKAFDRAGMAERACAHRVALAEIASDDAAALGAAVRCERALGRPDSARRLLESVSDTALRARAESASLAGPPADRRTGDVTLDATWSGGSDVDLTLITPQGSRLSWMGGRTSVFAQDAASSSHELLGLGSTGVGSYVIEVVRARAGDAMPISGNITVNTFGTRRSIPFTLRGERVVVGRVQVRRESRMESVMGGGW